MVIIWLMMVCNWCIMEILWFPEIGISPVIISLKLGKSNLAFLKQNWKMGYPQSFQVLGFPEIGISPVIIHSRLGFSINHPANLGYSHFRKPPNEDGTENICKWWSTGFTTKTLDLVMAYFQTDPYVCLEVLICLDHICHIWTIYVTYCYITLHIAAGRLECTSSTSNWKPKFRVSGNWWSAAGHGYNFEFHVRFRGRVNIFGILLMRMTSCAPQFIPFLSHTPASGMPQGRSAEPTNSLYIRHAEVMLLEPDQRKKKDVSRFPSCISIWDGKKTCTMFHCFISHWLKAMQRSKQWLSVMDCFIAGSSRFHSSPSTHWSSSYTAYLITVYCVHSDWSTAIPGVCHYMSLHVTTYYNKIY